MTSAERVRLLIAWRQHPSPESRDKAYAAYVAHYMEGRIPLAAVQARAAELGICIGANPTEPVDS